MNGGPITFTEVADFKLMPIKMFFNKNSLATILSFHDVAEIPGVNIRINKSEDRAIFVALPDSHVLKFTECSSGLYYVDIDNFNKTEIIVYSALSTIQDNEKLYSKQ